MIHQSLRARHSPWTFAARASVELVVLAVLPSSGRLHNVSMHARPMLTASGGISNAIAAILLKIWRSLACSELSGSEVSESVRVKAL